MAQLARGGTAAKEVKNKLEVSLPRAVLLPCCLTWAFPRGWPGMGDGRVGNSWQQKTNELEKECLHLMAGQLAPTSCFLPKTL